jgi:uncharacterized protein (DUF58 family)
MHRKLELTLSGKWYVALTIALGVIALVSANNVLYLIESLLLSGLILSGILSERAVSAIRVDVRRAPASAGARSRDQLRVTNTTRAAVFCVEVGEWCEGRFVPLAFLPRLAPLGSSAPPSRQRFERRGKHRWQGLAVATSYPFGFARKIRIFGEPGERLVWPAREEDLARAGDPGGDPRRTPRAPLEPAEGEIRPFVPEDDSRRIVWTLSAKGTGKHVRVLRSRGGDPEVVLDARGASGEEFERRVREAARPFHGLEPGSRSGKLTVVSSERTLAQGRERALDLLALAEAS